MKKNHLAILLSVFAFFGFSACNNQTDETSKIVLNEVLPLNKSNFQDDYGLYNAWIEVFNKSYGTVDIAGYKLRTSNKAGDTVTYNVPKGDVLTKIKPRQHALFWADGEPNRGTFHTKCTLDTAGFNWIGLYDNGGKLIDSISVKPLPADYSYARINDAHNDWVVKGGNNIQSYVTPSTNNMTIEKNEKQEKFSTHDGNGIGMTLTAMSVVFSGLLILYISFRLLGIGMQFKKKGIKNNKLDVMTENKSTDKTAEKEKEVYAAIAMALHEEFNSVHDIESGVLTITRSNSQWNAKHLLLRK